MNVLVDTSVWIEFFSRRPRINLVPLELMIEERRTVTCLPILAEMLSGKPAAATRATITHAFESMTFIDPDWKVLDVWHKVADLAQEAYKAKMPVPSLVDRMILLSAREAGARLWTLDLKLDRLARFLGVAYHESSK